jgi:hypothetical protein
MANEIENILKNAATRVAKYVNDAATMQVETKYVLVDKDGSVSFDQAKPIAQTIVKLDGDSQSIIPVRLNEAGGLEVDTALYDVHSQNVTATTDYRARVLNSLLSTLMQR